MPCTRFINSAHEIIVALELMFDVMAHGIHVTAETKLWSLKFKMVPGN
jgi:hypothetical protein